MPTEAQGKETNDPRTQEKDRITEKPGKPVTKAGWRSRKNLKDEKSATSQEGRGCTSRLSDIPATGGTESGTPFLIQCRQ
ncbi:hypothetical protein NDU88_003499 [Pleurodeles waltl]|uniref:Uncharacterized protein n=1 Tax=Pleurodeles waltl TaxID=8319 RepID=A0AAV7VFR2_PLEWA|nr:hypothetical protein NDU88_003499 [Pleurodeles waltl]